MQSAAKKRPIAAQPLAAIGRVSPNTLKILSGNRTRLHGLLTIVAPIDSQDRPPRYFAQRWQQ